MRPAMSEYWGKFYRSIDDPSDFIEVMKGNKMWIFVRHVGTSEVSWISQDEIEEDYEEVIPETSVIKTVY